MKEHNKIYCLIEQLQNESSSNKKKLILKNWFNDEPPESTLKTAWLKFLRYVYDEVNYVYNLRVLPEPTESIENKTTTNLDDLFKLMDYLNKSTGDSEAKEKVLTFLQNSDDEINYLFTLLIDRSLNAGVESQTLVDCYPELDDLISPYYRCEKENMLDKRINYPAIAQTKADGLFINCFIQDNPKFITRYGNNAIIGGGLKTVISMLNKTDLKNTILMGELLVYKDGIPLPRQIGNGRVNSYINRFKTIKSDKKKIEKAKTEKAKDKIKAKMMEDLIDWEFTEKHLVLKFWDNISVSEFKLKRSNQPYINRLKNLNENLNKFIKLFIDDNTIEFNRLIPIETKIVNNKEEVYNFFEEMLEKGEEGLVVKNTNILWKHGTSRDGMIKLKDFKDCDLIITGYLPGEDMYTGGIGALICESSDGLIKVNPSSGLTMAQRGLERVDLNDSSKGWKPIDGFDLNQYNGKIVATKFNELLPADENGIHSLFLPSVEEIRESFDKQTADDLKTILNKKG
jgi:DNA ligase-1